MENWSWIDLNNVTDYDKEWKKKYEWSFCNGPAIVNGHKIACDLVKDHDGGCIAMLRSVRRHIGGGAKECIRCRCGNE